MLTEVKSILTTRAAMIIMMIVVSIFHSCLVFVTIFFINDDILPDPHEYNFLHFLKTSLLLFFVLTLLSFFYKNVISFILKQWLSSLFLYKRRGIHAQKILRKERYETQAHYFERDRIVLYEREKKKTIVKGEKRAQTRHTNHETEGLWNEWTFSSLLFLFLWCKLRQQRRKLSPWWEKRVSLSLTVKNRRHRKDFLVEKREGERQRKSSEMKRRTERVCHEKKKLRENEGSHGKLFPFISFLSPLY